MISDNSINPLVYEVSKIEDVFPLGTYKVTLKQTHFDREKDNVPEKLCDYYTTVNPKPSESVVASEYKLCMEGTDFELHLSGTSKRIYLEASEPDLLSVGWTFYLDEEELSTERFNSLFSYAPVDKGAIHIGAKKVYSLMGKVLRIRAVSDSGRTDFIELEVVR